MSTSVPVVAAVVIGVLGLAAVVGRLLTLPQGMLRAADAASHVDTSDLNLGLSTTGPTILHFSASWCGPCAAVRRVVDQVCAAVPGVAHVEVDMDRQPRCRQAPVGAVPADDDHLRCRRTPPLPHDRRPHRG